MAATNHTPIYQLNQWESSDQVLRGDFNEDNQKIEAALATIPHIATGSYVGTGSYGSANPNTLTFDFVPQMVAVVINAGTGCEYGTLLVRGQTKSGGIGVAQAALHGLDLTLAWEGNSVSWYSSGSSDQLNDSGVTYFYFAIG